MRINSGLLRRCYLYSGGGEQKKYLLESRISVDRIILVEN